MPVTARALRAADQAATAAEWCRVWLWLTGGSPPDPETPCDSGEVLGCWLHNLVRQLEFMPVAEQDVLLGHLRPGLSELGPAVDACPESDGFLLVLADGRYATWYNRSGWLDLRTGKDLPRPPRPLCLMTFNVGWLYHRKLAEIRRAEREIHPDPGSAPVRGPVDHAATGAGD